jgi:hypothetical protein
MRSISLTDAVEGIRTTSIRQERGGIEVRQNGVYKDLIQQDTASSAVPEDPRVATGLACRDEGRIEAATYAMVY